jgi:alpha-beta hydrolase superfamily lysophospholipase
MKQASNDKVLVVIFHAFGFNPDKMGHIEKITAELLPNVKKIHTPKLPFGAFDTTNLLDVVNNQLIEINELCNNDEYDRIILIGHSLGAGLARKIYICAHGQTDAAPFEANLSHKAGYLWADKIDRIILLAAVNRGWSISPHLSTRSAFTFGFLHFVEITASLMRCGKWFDSLAINQVKRGSTLVTNLRLQWLELQNKLKLAKKDIALVVQLLGSYDDLVMPDDDVDLVTGHHFVYLDIPNTNHFNIIEMDGTSNGRQRTEFYKQALTLSKDELMELSSIPTDDNDIVAQPNNSVTDVVFVVHGIRDEGFWTHKLARRVKRISKSFETETSSYGYFAILPFIIRNKRMQNVEWLMDKYVENKFLYPRAEFSFIGHSNGTYLLAKALEVYPYVKFKHVVFAGSVVNSNYKWSELFTSGRVKAVLNYVASNDLTVAFLPKGMGMLHDDVGGAGFDGFADEQVINFRYMKGKHSAALVEENWNNIANFIVTGNVPTNASYNSDIYLKERTSMQKIFEKLSNFSGLLWIAAIFLVVLVGWKVNSIELQGFQQSILLLGFYFSVIYFFLTRI